MLFLCFLEAKENDLYMSREKKSMGRMIETGDAKTKFTVTGDS